VQIHGIAGDIGDKKIPFLCFRHRLLLQDYAQAPSGFAIIIAYDVKCASVT